MLQALLLSFLLADKGDYAVLTVSVYVCDKLVKTLWTDMCEIFGVDGIRTRNYVFDCCFDTVEDRHFPEFSSSDICVNVLYLRCGSCYFSDVIIALCTVARRLRCYWKL